MGLKNHNGPLILQFIQRVKQGLKLTGMMGIVVIDIRSVKLAFELKPPSCTVESRQTVFHGIGPDPKADGSRCGGQSVFYIVHTRHMQCNLGKLSSLVVNVKGGMGASVADIAGIDVCIVFHAEGHNLPSDSLQGIHGVFIIGIGNHYAPIFRNLGCKNPEAPLPATLYEKDENYYGKA